MNRMLLLALCLLPFAAWGSDDYRVRYLEQEVRNLQRQMQALTRQVQTQGSRPPRPAALGPVQPSTAPTTGGDFWVDAGKWQRVRAGMGELEVIETLGPPTSMRETDGARILFYAMEIGASGFLGGSVTLRDRVVTEVRKPELQ